MNISAIVMASGLSKRMKTNKLNLEINSKKIYEYILETIKKYDFYETIIVSKDENILKKSEDLGFHGVRNKKYCLGQSESIKAGINASKNTDGFMFFVADQPFIKLKTIQLLCKEFYKNPNNIIMPYYNGTRGNPVIFPFALKDKLLSLENDDGGKVVINNNQDLVMRVDIITKYENMDIDTIEDYEKVKNMKM